jgi:tricorn protease
MTSAGYYRFPAIHGGQVVFTADDDLWTVPAIGGLARRLTANLSAIQHPFFAPDGSTLAFTAREEGHPEVYTMPSEGGPLRRVTHFGATSNVVGWSADGAHILFSSNAAQPFERVGVIYGAPVAGGLPERWPIGPAVSITHGSNGRSAIGRNNNDPARWKRYRGGTAGEIWVDADGNGEYRPLIRLEGNIGRPMWIGERIFFLSDHEGIGNIYSCTAAGDDLERHTTHRDYFARFPNSDGARIVYHAGADLYLYDPAADTSSRIAIGYHSPRVQRSRRFVDAARYLDSYALHPQGHSLAVTSRGRSFVLGNWEGAVIAQQPADGPDAVRYRLTRWLNDGRRLVTITDRSGEERLEIHAADERREPEQLVDLDIGIVYAFKVSPVADQLLLANHRHELLHVDLEARTLQRIARSEFQPINGFDWSSDGCWAAFGFSTSPYSTGIRLWHRDSGETHVVTEPVLRDLEPAFDPDGRYLYFLGMRELNPVYDNLQFELGFPRGMKPYLVTLRADEPSPLQARPRPLEEDPTSKSDAATQAQAITIDLDGIRSRVVALPVPLGIYAEVVGIKGKALFTSLPVEGALGPDSPPGDQEAKATLESFDFKTQKHEPLVRGVTSFQVSQDGKTLAYRAGRRLRVIRAGQKADNGTRQSDGPDGKGSPGRESGWIDLGRLRIAIDPGAEWRQMAREAWRLQREYFWTADMSRVDWNAVWDRYAPLVERVGTRAEFSDLMWEMQGELGTSHAYEMGGDYRPEPSFPQGFLGADFHYDEAAAAFRIRHVVQGAAGEAEGDSPLNGPGVGVRPGDTLLAINGRRVDLASPPGALLVHQAGVEVALTIGSGDGSTREITLRTLRSEFRARYREWVARNRLTVHDATQGRIGYLHIPDMGPHGFAEFHRLYLVEAARDGLVVDVRFNSGGHVSPLLIEKLRRKPLGYDVSRWGQPEPYPTHAIAGPLVALTNEWAGSDGDIFSHVFKLLGLGPLIGKRTWGGVIGISPRRMLADGSVTTQPEYSFWFKDVGWGVENYGTDPDITVEMAPQDYAHGRDPQLERAITVALERLAAEPVVRPPFDDRPNLAPPKLR